MLALHYAFAIFSGALDRVIESARSSTILLNLWILASRQVCPRLR